MSLLNKIEAFLDGKKTYIVAILGGIAGILEASGINIPAWVWPILAALGFGAVRSAIGNSPTK